MDLDKLNKFRVKNGPWGTGDNDLFGLFFIGIRKGKTPLKVISAPFDKPVDGWEHVSVSLPNRCPTWEEMCKVKDLFWSKDQAVIQFHPPESEYVNNHPYCLHLWRCVDRSFPLPDSSMVGVK